MKEKLYIFVAGGLEAPSSLGGPATVGEIITRVTNLLLGIAGTASVIMIIVGGIMYATSAGNDQGTARAKSTITNAIIGLVISILAFSIINFVMGTVFK